MKIVICTTPIRPAPTQYPPFGSMALIQSLRAAGYEPYFYDIDGLRPSFDSVVQFFRDQQPDIVGISAVVSTAYAYTKRLSSTIKSVSPHTKIVVGGNLAASAELLLRLCCVDACAIGEGEHVIVNLAHYWGCPQEAQDSEGLKEIPGIAYLSSAGEVVFTGYDAPIAAHDFLDPDWTILEQFSNIDNYVKSNAHKRYEFARDPRTFEPHRRGKKLATVLTAKGCVARCTFCHRWDKGYRHWPVDRVVRNIKYLIERYNVGFIDFGDENFGSDRKKLDELLEALKPLDILYKVTGVRVRSVDPDLLRRMKESGCVAVYFGMETGSPTMLQVMEKNATLEMNINAARWTHEAGLYTIYQMVLAMPGENDKTIKETTQFLKRVTEFLPEPPRRRMSINYIQALPGTPVYEYARAMGLIGKTLQEEEAYLMRISDTDAADDGKMLNFTNYDFFSVKAWRPKIVFDVQAHWYQKHNWMSESQAIQNALLSAQPDPDSEAASAEDYSRGGYFNLPAALVNRTSFYRFLCFPLCYPLHAMFPLFYAVTNRSARELPKRRYLRFLRDYAARRLLLNRRRALRDIKSLRKVVKDLEVVPSTASEASMKPLRDGR